MWTWESEATYKKSWNRQNRGLLIFLLDQSGSMQQKVQVNGQSYTNGQLATGALNNLIYSVTTNTPIDAQTGRLKDYCDILVLGYGDKVETLLDNGKGLPVSISELADNPTGHNQVLVERYDHIQNKRIQVVETQPFWIQYTAQNSMTEMAKALQRSYEVMRHWLEMDARHRQSFPPIVINITDGEHNGAGNPLDAASQIHQVYTSDGHALLFSCHLTSNNTSHIVFPQHTQQITEGIKDPTEREWAKKLFTMSSIIPPSMIKRARESFAANIQDGARGFLYNANPSDLVEFLSWGTRPSQN